MICLNAVNSRYQSDTVLRNVGLTILIFISLYVSEIRENRDGEELVAALDVVE